MERKRYTLTDKQLRLLHDVFRFRFVSAPLLTRYLGLKHNSIIKNLAILVDQGYIARQYDKSYKIDRKPALYYLDKKGITLLMKDPDMESKTLHALYKNSVLSDALKQHCLDALFVYTTLQASFPRLPIYTKMEYAHHVGFPDLKPDLYIAGERDYFIMLIHDMQLFVAKKWFEHLIDYCEEQDAGTSPALIFVLRNERDEMRFRAYIDEQLELQGIKTSEFLIGTMTISALTNAQSFSETPCTDMTGAAITISSTH
jgi:hypothetical protein